MSKVLFVEDGSVDVDYDHQKEAKLKELRGKQK